MPAKSVAQQRFMGMVYSYLKGEMPNASDEVKKAAKGMSKKDAKKYASTKHDDLPEKKEVKESTGEERFCMLCGKNEYKEECSYGPNMWNWFTVDKLSESIMNGEVITEKRDGKSSKDKGYSLRDWFKGGGWKQTGGKYDGKPCAKQPGQKTKPYCRDADDRAAMSKKERNKRAAKKRREDPNPNRKGKAKNVTQESYSNWRKDLAESYLRVQERGKTYSIILNWRGRTLQIQMFFAKFSRPTKDEVKAEIHKVYPNAIVLYYNPVPKDPTKPLLFAGERDEPRRN